MGSKVARIRLPAYRDAPLEFERHNAERAAQGARLRNAIAAMMIESPHILAREVRTKLNGCELGRRSLPRKRAIQLHMQAIRARISREVARQPGSGRNTHAAAETAGGASC